MAKKAINIFVFIRFIYSSNLVKTIYQSLEVQDIVNNIFSVSTETFEDVALQIFHYQYKNNSVYRTWVNTLKIDVDGINTISRIPFLPISFFKSHEIITGSFDPKITFESSGTTGSVNSRHHVKDVKLYTQSFINGFKMFYGDPSDWCIIGLLPSYLERKGSSLVMMVDELIKLSGHKESGFYLQEYDKLALILRQLESRKQKTLLIGVTYALLDFAEHFPMELQHTTIMETGGMKGRRKEMIRDEVHAFLMNQFNIASVHSEYGMTELLSQCYSKGRGIFESVPWMKILVRDEDDPFMIKKEGRGLINVIDLANIHSCSFIATDDVGRLYDDGNFEVLGRMDSSDVRGCSLMVL